MYEMALSPEVEEMLVELSNEPIAEIEVQEFIERIKTDATRIYCFPLSQARSAIEAKGLAQLSVDELLQRLEELSSRQDSSGAANSYAGTARTLFCAINIKLNERCAIAPHFRSMRRPDGNKGHSISESNQSNDRQVIDLHWLHCSGKRDRLSHEEFANLFARDQFDFELAAALASKPWTPEHKSLSVLNLLDFEMHQLSWFRCEVVRNKWQNGIRRMNGAIDRHLRAQTVREPSFAKHVDGMKNVWLAMYLVGQHGPVATAKYYGWMTGQTLAKSTWSEKVKTMKKRTGMNL